jgi:hypothetical protein
MNIKNYSSFNKSYFGWVHYKDYKISVYPYVNANYFFVIQLLFVIA